MDWPIIVTPAADQDNVFYAYCSDMYMALLNMRTLEIFPQVTLIYDPKKHPDEIVKDLAEQLNNYTIVKDFYD